MSQAGQVNSASGPVPPAVPTSFVTDVNSPSVPVANIENVIGGTITTNNNNGVQTDGSSGGNTLTVQLTNRIIATATTTDGVTPVTVYSFSLGATPASFLFFSKLVAFDVTSNQGAGYNSFRCVRTSGAVGTLIGADAGFIEEEGDMTNVNAVNGISGNNQQLVVTGIAGHTIHWKVLVEYISVS